MVMVKEERRYPRVAFNGLVRLFPLEEQGKPAVFSREHTATALDVSEQGIGVRVDRALEVGASWKVCFRMTADQEAAAVAKVAWSSGLRAGLSFSMVDPYVRKALRFYVETLRRGKKHP